MMLVPMSVSLRGTRARAPTGLCRRASSSCRGPTSSGLAAAVANCIRTDRVRSMYPFPSELDVKRGRWHRDQFEFVQFLFSFRSVFYQPFLIAFPVRCNQNFHNVARKPKLPDGG